MIDFKKVILENGLTVIAHYDEFSPLVAVNVMYNVGARDEHPDQTGFAHLFEHLMFSGSENAPDFDSIVQLAGGENNAFTSNDVTNYYITLPANNIETALFVEADRMNALNVNQQNLDTQKSVVIEEFKQRYLNQPYGDVMLHLRPLAYKVHPYQWATIGKNIEQIEQATLIDVKNFYDKHYNPNQAILVISGGIKEKEAIELAKKWFGQIQNKGIYKRNLKLEPVQEVSRKLTLKGNVSADAIYMAFHMCKRSDKNYYIVDLISDILSRGDSSRLYRTLVREKQLFSSISAYVTGSFDEGLFIISGKLNNHVTCENAENAVFEELKSLSEVTQRELDKVKNKTKSTLVFNEVGILNKATQLAYFTLINETASVNQELNKYLSVSLTDVRNAASTLFQKEKSNVIYYLSNSSK
jgi:zinc protease